MNGTNRIDTQMYETPTLVKNTTLRQDFTIVIKKAD